jgi:hypothetical protein
MEKKLKNIYNFLKTNRQFNKAVQEGFYKFCIGASRKRKDKARSLLFHILNTQSQPKIDKVAVFWQAILKGDDKLSSFKKFYNAIKAKSKKGNPDQETPFLNLFKALKAQPGWGNKTAALFVKAVYHVHKWPFKKYAFWKDVPALSKTDQLRLPVDTVISYIFKKLSNGKIKSFAGINKLLTENNYTGKKMEVWDDLWFWGFITQKGTAKRTFGFNEAKYWVMPYSDKSHLSIRTIKANANKFKKLITAK